MTKNDPTATRITNQYRDRAHGVVYELRSGGAALVLRATQSADETAEWRFEAHPMQAPQLVVVGSWGATRTDAFRAVRELWLDRASSLGLAVLDWDQVASALTAVRAL
jgi:hypothetical protein